MSVKIDFFESVAKEIEGKFKRISHLLKKANLKSGEYHEEIIRQSLSNFLSKRYSVKTGYIYLDNGKTSKQIDILLIDESYPFTYLFQDKDFVIVRPEPVIAAIEVKSSLYLQHFKDTFENIYTAKQLKKEALGYYGHIYGSVFGYSSNKTINDSVLDRWFKDKAFTKYDKEPEMLWPDSIFFFDHGLFLHLDHDREFDKESKKAFFYKLYRENDQNDKAWQLALLITFLMAMCENEDNSMRHTLARAKSLDIMDFNEAAVGNSRFRPKEGYSEFKPKQ